jgi:hypothetical protein
VSKPCGSVEFAGKDETSKPSKLRWGLRNEEVGGFDCTCRKPEGKWKRWKGLEWMEMGSAPS